MIARWQGILHTVIGFWLELEGTSIDRDGFRLLSRVKVELVHVALAVALLLFTVLTL